MSKNVLNEGVLQAKKSLPIWAIVLIFIAGLAIGFGAFWLIWTARMSKVVQNQNLPTPVANSNQPPPDVSLPSVTSSLETPPIQEGKGFKPRVDLRSVALDVKWQSPRKLSYKEALKLFTTEPTLYSSDVIKESLQYYYDPARNEETPGLQVLWKAGVVNSGTDKGNTVYILQDAEEGMGTWYSYTYLMQDSQVPSAIYAIGVATTTFEGWQKVSDAAWPIRAYAIQMPNAVISSLEQPVTLTLQNGKTLGKNDLSGFWGSSEPHFRFLLEEAKDVKFTKVARTMDSIDVFEKTTVYTDSVGHEGCLYAFGPDGSVNKYSSLIPSVEGDDPSRGKTTIPSITWNNGTTNKDAYEIRPAGGCGGYSDCVRVIDTSIMKKEDLVIVGKTSNGESIYEPKSLSEDSFVKESYDSWFLPDGKEKLSIQDFIQQNPHAVIFWQDAVGRWTILSLQKLIQPAECGKPVIYLYPTKTTPVSVSLPRFINVTVSEPTYPSRGWQTVAQPDGTLTMADGQQFGSLYWEGTGVGYVAPREGFVVKDGEQKIFLTETLAKYGLNAKESQEFMDFWLSQMTGAPYYRVSFLTDDWSKAAPLNVNPKPDTNIRIFMDWQKLSAPISITQPKIITPVRNGFTLVEWGGLLYK